MTRLILEGGKMKSEDDFHDQIAVHPETPEFYGRNLDALFDVLVGFFASPVEVIWREADLARAALGKRFTLITDTFGDAEEEWHAKGGSLGMILEQDESGS